MIDIILSSIIDQETGCSGVNETCLRSHGIFLKIILLARTEKPTQPQSRKFIVLATSPEVHQLWTQFSPEDHDISRAMALCDFSQLWLLSSDDNQDGCWQPPGLLHIYRWKSDSLCNFETKPSFLIAASKD